MNLFSKQLDFPAVQGNIDGFQIVFSFDGDSIIINRTLFFLKPGDDKATVRGRQSLGGSIGAVGGFWVHGVSALTAG
jgi:hypothetical protein